MRPRRLFAPGFRRGTNRGRVNNTRYYREEVDEPSYLMEQEKQVDGISKSLEEWRRKRRKQREETKEGSEEEKKKWEKKKCDLNNSYGAYYDDIDDRHVTRPDHGIIRQEGRNKKTTLTQISSFGSSPPFSAPVTSNSKPTTFNNNHSLTHLHAIHHEIQRTGHETPASVNPRLDFKTTTHLINRTRPDSRTLTSQDPKTHDQIVAKIDEDNEQDLEDNRAESAKEAIQGNFGELNDRTTALCCSAQVRGAPITLVVDTGASGSVAGKQFLDNHRIQIDRPSSITITNINGEQRRPLGAIDQLPVTVETIEVPIKIDVTESEAYSVIVGNDWLRKVQATIGFHTSTMIIRDGGKEVHVPVTYLREPLDSLEPILSPQGEDNEGEYLSNEETIRFQERKVNDVDWGGLRPEEIERLPRPQDIRATRKGISVNRRQLTWSEIQGLHQAYQRPTNRSSQLDQKTSSRCWCEEPKSNCRTCRTGLGMYAAARTHMTKEQDERILDIEGGEKNEGGNGWEWEHLAKNEEEPEGHSAHLKEVEIEGLTVNQKAGLTQVLEEFEDIFAEDLSGLGKTNVVQHEIPLEPTRPTRLRAYRANRLEQDFIKQEIGRMLHARIIRESSSPWAFPVVVVKKKNE